MCAATGTNSKVDVTNMYIVNSALTLASISVLSSQREVTQ